MTAKILFVTSKSIGGSGKYLAALGRGINEQVNSDLAYSRSGILQDGELEQSFGSVHLFPSTLRFNMLSLLRDFAFLVRLLRKERYDIIHTHTSLGGLLGRLASLFSPQSVVVHTLHTYGANEFTPRPQKWLYWLIEKLLDFRTHAYIAPSRFMIDYGVSVGLVSPDKARLIYNALPLETPSDAIRKQGRFIRSELELSNGEVLFLFCGRLEEQKGADVLVRAVARIRDHHKFRVLMCGDGVLAADLKELAASEGVADRFIWLGWQDDPTRFYAASDIFILPSRWESFGLVFLEAMNHGLPVLSTNSQAIPEVVEDEVTGLLCAREDPAALADNMLRLLADEQYRRGLGECGRKRLASEFSYERFLEDHLQYYAQLLSSAGEPVPVRAGVGARPSHVGNIVNTSPSPE